mgnify:CR=1 FL=1
MVRFCPSRIVKSSPALAAGVDCGFGLNTMSAA